MPEADFTSQLTTFFSVILLDIVLAGDNAVVVGLAASGLPAEQKRRAIILGIGLAFLCRILFAAVAVQLLAIVGLLLAGGILLLWVAWKMWRELRDPKGEEHAAELLPPEDEAAAAGEVAAPRKTFMSAFTQIAIADVSMSLDNVLAVAGTARDHFWILVFGLLLSIALMGVAATYIAKLMERHHWIAYIGFVLVLWVAIDMIWEGSMEVWHAVEGTPPGEGAPRPAH